MGDGDGWAAEQLTTFLAALSVAGDRDVLVQRAIDLAAELLEAEIAAFVEAGQVVNVTGWPRGQAPTELILAAIESGDDVHRLPGIGDCRLLVSPLEGDGSVALVVGRLDAGDFGYDDRNLIRAMARILALSLRACSELQRERSMRSASDQQAEEYRQLLRTVEERQILLERLTRIQRSITTGAPLDQVLQAIVTGAKELLRCDAATARRIDPSRTDSVVVVASAGVDDDSPLRKRSPVGEGISGRAILENRLVVVDDYRHHAGADPGTRALGVRVGMAAPVLENGVVVASLAVGSFDPERKFTAAEQEVLVSFAAHASLAITEARTNDALRRQLRDAQHEAMHDDLTGLGNRSLLRTRLEQASRRRRRDDEAIALLFLDLDNFKHVNDSLGHEVGDALLISVANRLADALRPTDTIARLGGDEFAVLVEGIMAAEEGRQVAERLLRALDEPFDLGERSVTVAASIGIALWDGYGDVHALLRNADLAMYEAKRSGGDRCIGFEMRMHDTTLELLNLEHDLRAALAAGDIRVHYQPMFDLTTGRVRGVEALARWTHPDRGPVNPAEFIAVAEASSVIHTLGEHVLRLAATEATKWPEDVALSVNLSARQITPQLPQRVAEILKQTGLDPSRLIIEVTESIAMNATEMLDVLAQLRRIGIRVAIDDFGTGYSSLARLRNLPVDTLKIDRSFVADVCTKEGLAVAAAIFALSRAIGLTTVAEGVETEEQLDTLRRLGCDSAQGYLLARPGEPETIAESLRSAVNQKQPEVA